MILYGEIQFFPIKIRKEHLVGSKRYKAYPISKTLLCCAYSSNMVCKAQWQPGRLYGDSEATTAATFSARKSAKASESLIHGRTRIVLTELSAASFCA